ncbi:uncharacterized protein LOC134010193 isoform X2 [Osmerus eperlanus]|uniref:uncharacterized protein LOC134010193 isoform X2 n=1 Tax=Osmerus eperlanus TaxID=29151 RepID=UPI002E0E3DA5
MNNILQLLLFVTIALCTSTVASDEPKVINVQSRELKSPEGWYVYKYDGRGASEVIVTIDKTIIAWYFEDSPKSKINGSLVQRINLTEIILKEPLSLNISVHEVKDGGFITEKQVYIVLKDELSTSAPPATTKLHENDDSFPRSRIGVIGGTLAALAALVVLAYIWWRRKNGKDPGQDANKQNYVSINMPERDQREEVQAAEDGGPEDHNEQTPFLHPDPGEQIQEGLEEQHLEEYVVNMDEQESGQDFGEEGECKPAEKGNAEQTGAGMLEHGDWTTSPQDGPLVVPNEEETRSEHSYSCGVSKTSGKGKRDNTKNSGGTEEQPNSVEFVGTMTNYETKL